MTLSYSQHKLSNGLRILLVPKTEVDSATALFLFRVGGRDDRPSEEGIAHFSEHIRFQGTRLFKTSRELTGTVEALGGVINAATDLETTEYFIKLESRHLKKGLAILRELILFPLFDPAAIQKEKGVILEEIRRGRDHPEEYVFEKMGKIIFPGQGLGQKVVGREETIGALTAQSLRQQNVRFYAPQNTLLVLSGKVGESVLGEVAEFFGEWSGSERPSVNGTWLSQKSISDFEERKVDQLHLVWGTYGFPLGGEARFALQVLATVLGRGMSSRLFAKLRDELGIAYSVFSHSPSYTDAGEWYVYAGLNAKKAGEGWRVIKEELEKLALKKVDPAELKKAKRMRIGHLKLSLEETDQVADFLSRQLLLTGKILSPNEIVRRFEAVGPDELLGLARKLLAQPFFIAAVGPRQGLHSLGEALDVKN